MDNFKEPALSAADTKPGTVKKMTLPVLLWPVQPPLQSSQPPSLNAIITVVEDPVHSLGKQFFLRSDGTVSKKSSVNVSFGFARMHRAVTPEEMKTHLETVSKNPRAAIINATFDGIDVGEIFLVLSAKELEKRTGIPAGDRERQKGVHRVTHNGKSYKAVGRFKDNVQPSCWQLFDRDIDKHTPAQFAELNFEQWVQAVDKMVPGFAKMTHLHVPSTSSRVLKDGVPVGAGNGHVWIKFANPDDLDRFRTASLVSAAQVDMTWLKPRFSSTEPGKVVGQSLTTLIDPSVFTAGRLIFVGQPVISDGLTIMQLTATIHTGPTDTLDTSATKLPDPEVIREVTRRAGVEMGVTVSGTGLRTTTSNLTLDTEIETQNDGTHTVREFIELGIADKIRCQTPFRDSSSFAAFLSVNSDGKPFIHDSGTSTTHWLNEFDAADLNLTSKTPSQGTNLQAPPLHRRTRNIVADTDSQATFNALTSMQRKFGLINMNGRICVFDRTALDTRDDRGAAQRLILSNRSDGTLLIERALCAEYGDVDSKKVLGQFWKSPDTKCYSGVDFKPLGTSASYLNLWVGPTIVPVVGSWDLIRAFLLEVLCDGNQTYCAYLTSYIAHALQRPEEKPGVAINLLGGQGIGKGTLARILQLIWSATFLQVSNVDAVTGNFNAALERIFIVFMDEALFAGDRRASDALKSLVTEPVIHINEKHQPSRQTHSYHRFFAATNADHLKNTDRDDRRDFSLRVSEARKNDQSYWKALYSEIDNGGVQAMVHDLLAMDLSEFNVRAKPNTEELLEQKLQSLEPIARWWYGCLVDGALCGNGKWQDLAADLDEEVNWPDFVATDAAISCVMDVTGGKVYRKPSSQDIVKALKKLCPSAVSGQKDQRLGRKRGLELPPLEQARADFDRYIGAPVAW